MSNDDSNTPIRRTARARKVNSKFATDEYDDSFKSFVCRMTSDNSILLTSNNATDVSSGKNILKNKQNIVSEKSDSKPGGFNTTSSVTKKPRKRLSSSEEVQSKLNNCSEAKTCVQEPKRVGVSEPSEASCDVDDSEDDCPLKELIGSIKKPKPLKTYQCDDSQPTLKDSLQEASIKLEKLLPTKRPFEYPDGGDGDDSKVKQSTVINGGCSTKITSQPISMSTAPKPTKIESKSEASEKTSTARKDPENIPLSKLFNVKKIKTSNRDILEKLAKGKFLHKQKVVDKCKKYRILAKCKSNAQLLKTGKQGKCGLIKCTKSEVHLKSQVHESFIPSQSNSPSSLYSRDDKLLTSVLNASDERKDNKSGLKVVGGISASSELCSDTGIKRRMYQGKPRKFSSAPEAVSSPKASGKLDSSFRSSLPKIDNADSCESYATQTAEVDANSEQNDGTKKKGMLKIVKINNLNALTSLNKSQTGKYSVWTMKELNIEDKFGNIRKIPVYFNVNSNKVSETNASPPVKSDNEESDAKNSSVKPEMSENAADFNANTEECSGKSPASSLKCSDEAELSSVTDDILSIQESTITSSQFPEALQSEALTSVDTIESGCQEPDLLSPLTMSCNELKSGSIKLENNTVLDTQEAKVKETTLVAVESEWNSSLNFTREECAVEMRGGCFNTCNPLENAAVDSGNFKESEDHNITSLLFNEKSEEKVTLAKEKSMICSEDMLREKPSFDKSPTFVDSGRVQIKLQALSTDEVTENRCAKPATDESFVVTEVHESSVNVPVFNKGTDKTKLNKPEDEEDLLQSLPCNSSKDKEILKRKQKKFDIKNFVKSDKRSDTVGDKECQIEEYNSKGIQRKNKTDKSRDAAQKEEGIKIAKKEKSKEESTVKKLVEVEVKKKVEKNRTLKEVGEEDPKIVEIFKKCEKDYKRQKEHIKDEDKQLLEKRKEGKKVTEIQGDKSVDVKQEDPRKKVEKDHRKDREGRSEKKDTESKSIGLLERESKKPLGERRHGERKGEDSKENSGTYRRKEKDPLSVASKEPSAEKHAESRPSKKESGRTTKDTSRTELGYERASKSSGGGGSCESSSHDRKKKKKKDKDREAGYKSKAHHAEEKYLSSECKESDKVAMKPKLEDIVACKSISEGNSSKKEVESVKSSQVQNLDLEEHEICNQESNMPNIETLVSDNSEVALGDLKMPCDSKLDVVSLGTESLQDVKEHFGESDDMEDKNQSGEFSLETLKKFIKEETVEDAVKSEEVPKYPCLLPLENEQDKAFTASTESMCDAVEDTKEEDASEVKEVEVQLSPEEQERHNKAIVDERMRMFVHLDENFYLYTRRKHKRNKEVMRMPCDCSLTKEEIERGEKGCGEDCLNRLLMIECGSRCPLKELCTNRHFQSKDYAQVEVFNADMKGCGVRASDYIPQGKFIMEYIGEVFDLKEFKRRKKEYAKESSAHFYFMSLRPDELIDATRMGNISRFVNHSCDPNAVTQKWTVNGELRIGFFAAKEIFPGEEINFDYRLERYGREPQKCYCGTSVCRGWLGEPPGEKTKEEKDEERRRLVKEKRKEEKRAYFENIDLDDEIQKLCNHFLRNRDDTLTLCRVMVRVEDLDARMTLLSLLQTGEKACRRLFLDYHGLKLLWSWMADLSITYDNLLLQIEILKTLECLPVTNKTQLIDSKVLAVVEKWSKEEVAAKEEPPAATSTPCSELMTFNEVDAAKKSSDTSDSDTEPESKTSATSSSAETSEENSLDSNEVLGTATPVSQNLEDSSENLNSMLPPESQKVLTAEDGSESRKPLPETVNVHDYKTPERNDLGDTFESRLKLLVELAVKLITTWSDLKEAYRIPKKERVELMKEHEREVEMEYRQYLDEEKSREDRLSKDYFFSWKRKLSSDRDRVKRPRGERFFDDKAGDLFKMSKEERRQLFEIKAAQEEEETKLRRLQEGIWEKHVEHCRLVAQDPFMTPLFDSTGQFYWDPLPSVWQPFVGNVHGLPLPVTYGPKFFAGMTATNASPHPLSEGSFSSSPSSCHSIIDPMSIPLPGEVGTPILTTPSPTVLSVSLEGTPSPLMTLPLTPELPNSFGNEDGITGPTPVTLQLPSRWKIASDPEGRLYFYHSRTRAVQWDVPIAGQKKMPSGVSSPESESDSDLDSDESDSSSSAPSEEFSSEEEDEEEEEMSSALNEPEELLEGKMIRRQHGRKRRSEALVQERVISPISEFDREFARQERREAKERAKEEARLEKLAERNRAIETLNTQTVMEIDPTGNSNLTEREQLELILQPKPLRMSSKERSKEKSKLRQQSAYTDNSEFARKVKDAFRAKMATYIVSVLNPYRKSDCAKGRITSTEDFKYLAKKLTHHVMVKELKQLRSIEMLDCSESVKHKTRDFVRKYMNKYGPVFVRDPNDTKEY